MSLSLTRSFSVVCAALFSATVTQADELDALFPIPAEVRTILDQRCVMCHGEEIDGEREIREDLIFSTDAEIRETLIDPYFMYELIRDDEMPQEAKLSFRLRRDAKMQERLDQLVADYEAKNEKAVLIKWLTTALKIEE
ncbi:hypothetical protein [Actomonas aquatica]|uniref:Cytochrome C Planctomycete-type domain-containing protein n=1 Tax=Actomonas aquatica TaxID=2866162 RepID=A0ABZ1CG22_9BACT|nr:hypothetical protein [Opitutus sp. WL0086]WRQ89514.1 hypothetical protein K1X11_008835 [Opitutus sp. WL0086]